MADWARSLAVALLVLTLPTTAISAGAGADAPKRPQRIVSTNLCTDQMLLYLVEPERIISLEYLSWEKDATPPKFQPLLKRIKQNHGLAEEVLMMDPDLVVGGTFSAFFSNSMMKRLGKSLILVDPENNFEEWYDRVRQMGQAVGEPERAEALIADFKAQLAAMQAEIPPGEMPIFVDLGGGYVAGKGTLTAQIVNAGGFRSLGDALNFSGSRAVPLEKLIQVDASAVSTNGGATTAISLTGAALNHPLRRMMSDRALAHVDIPSRYLICTTPETLKMVRALVDARKQVDRLRAERGEAGAIVSQRSGAQRDGAK